MSFDVDAEAYGRFMGRFSEPLAAQFVDLAEIRAGQRVLDVGCGPGALTMRLVERLGVDAVSAIDPSASFVTSLRNRVPHLDVRSGVAEELPFPDDAFDRTLAQLVVHFMSAPVVGLTQMRRVTRPGGLVAASVWDNQTGGGPLGTFWRAVHETDPAAPDESHRAGVQEGQLTALCKEAGFEDPESSSLTVRVRFDTFAQWWEPYTLGVGPAGAYVAALEPDRRERLRDRCEQLLPPAPFEVAASAWCVRARA